MKPTVSKWIHFLPVCVRRRMHGCSDDMSVTWYVLTENICPKSALFLSSLSSPSSSYRLRHHYHRIHKYEIVVIVVYAVHCTWWYVMYNTREYLSTAASILFPSVILLIHWCWWFSFIVRRGRERIENENVKKRREIKIHFRILYPNMFIILLRKQSVPPTQH